MTGRDTYQIIQWVTTCEEVEGHEDPRKVAALHREAPDRDLNIRHKLGPDVDDAEEVRALHQHVVVGNVGVQHPNDGIKEQHSAKISLLLLPKVLLNRIHGVINHYHAE